MTKTSIIRTGYWVHQNLEDPNFDFLEYAYSGVHDLMEYLHGSCTLFALALHALTGIPMYALVDVDEMEEVGCYDPASPHFPLIHNFCASGDIESEDDPAVFMDCRGAIANERAFLEEFRDFFTGYLLIQYTPEQIETVKKNIWNGYGSSNADQYYEEALGYIKGHIKDFTI